MSLGETLITIGSLTGVLIGVFLGLYNDLVWWTIGLALIGFIIGGYVVIGVNHKFKFFE